MSKDLKLLFDIQPSSGVAIYKQIIEQVRRLAASGLIKAGDELPSVRTAASELEVNPMTISKAYTILEATGHLTRLRGKGMIVSDNIKKEAAKSERLGLIRPALLDTLKQADQLGLSVDDIIKEIKKIKGDK